MENIAVINIMADGSICEDLSTYLGQDHQLPELVVTTISDMILAGHEARERNGG